MKTRSMLIAGALAALLGLSSTAQADHRYDRHGWSGKHFQNARHRGHYRHHRQHDRIRYGSYRRGYRDGYRDNYRSTYWYAPPRYYSHGAYGLNVWFDGIGVSYYESDRYCD